MGYTICCTRAVFVAGPLFILNIRTREDGGDVEFGHRLAGQAGEVAFEEDVEAADLLVPFFAKDVESGASVLFC